MTSAWWLDLPLPGAGLVLRGRLGSGLALLLPALLALSLLLLLALVGASDVWTTAWPALAGAYVLLGVVGTALHWRAAHPRPVDEAEIRRLHREAATAFLTDRHDAALAAADRLVRHAPVEPGAWRLLALVAGAAGDRDRAERARRRLARLLAERA